ncbi:MAG: hypothetical protein ABMB14_27510 [Myxococcota bacterium]
MADAPDRSESLAAMLADGVRALRAGRPHDAAAKLVAVCDDREFATATDLRDIRARASSLCAQALLDAGRPAEALPRAEVALGLARSLGDTEGVADVEQLRDKIRAAIDARAVIPPDTAQLAARSVEDIERRHVDPEQRAEWLVRKANAEIEAGRPGDAVAVAERAVSAAPGSVRVAVLARMTVARAAPERAATELQAALDLARDADAFTLVGAVVKAAELAGVPLDAEPGA